MEMNPSSSGLSTSGSFQRKSYTSVAISQARLEEQASHLSLLDEADGTSEPKRAQKLDGAFFEAFATVDQKQKGFLKQAKQDSKKQAKTLIEKQEADANSVFYSLFSKDSFTRSQGKLMYEELLYVVSHQLGKRKVGGDEISPGDLIVYGQTAFGISRDEHKTIYKKVRERRPPKTFVVVTIVEAKHLEAKDANGLSDPYCMLGILRDSEGRKMSRDGRRVKKIVLAELRDMENVRMTKIKMNTLDPVWNEQFSLEVNHVDNEILRIDLWDKDDSTVFLDGDNRITSIKSFSGFNRFLKEVASSAKSELKSVDDFLGLVEIYIRDIPSDGLEEEFDLEPRSRKSHVQGSLKVKVRLTAAQEGRNLIEDETISSPMKFQRKLLKWFLRSDYDEFFNSEASRNGPWAMQISEMANYLFHQFSIQESLSPYQEAIVRWEVYSKCIQDVMVPMEPLISLVDFIRSFGRRDDLDDYETEVFIKSTDEFLAYSMQLIRRHRLIFPPTGTDQCLRLGNLILCLLNIFKLPLFKATYPDRRITAEIEIELKAGTREWFEVAIAYNEAIERSDEAKLTSLVNVANSLIVCLKAAKKKYISLFKPTGVDYFSLVYTELELLLSETVKPILQLISERMRGGLDNQEYGTGLFELYLSLKNFKELKEFIPEVDRVEGPIDQYHEWFQLATSMWLYLAKLKATKRIKKAVELDEVRVVHSMLKHSASAVDVTCCLGQICVFWSKLKWPDVAGSYVFLTQITDIIASCAMEYANIVLDMLQKVDYYEGQGDEFDVNEKLCLTMNNLEHVLYFLDTIPETLSFEAVLEEMGREHGEERLKSLRETLENVIVCAQEDMRKKMDEIIVRTGERMKDEITKKLKYVCKAAATEEDPYELADGVLSYIDHNLVTLNKSLLVAAFKRYLLHIWEVFLFSMEDVVKETNRRDPKVFSALRQVLHLSQDFFSGDGDGISGDLISSRLFESLDKLLSLNESNSAQIVEKYYIEKCGEQGRTDEAFGAITFKVFYSQENHALHVNVMNVRDIPPLDSNNLADPYVQIELVPKHAFKSIPDKRTSIQQETRFAIFDENFSFGVSLEDCRQPGATLMMTVYDHDRFHENDIAGEVFVDLCQIPGLDMMLTGGFFSIPQSELPLIHGAIIGQPFRVLSERKDAVAANFVKLRKEKFKKMEDCIAKARERQAKM